MKPKIARERLTAQNAQPKSAEEFASLWKVPDGVDILRGDASIPNVIERQHRFVGYVLNLCIVTHVYERLKSGATYESLALFFKKPAQQDIEKLSDASQSDEQRLTQLVDMSKRGKILSQRDLVSTDAWSKFVQDFDNFVPDGPSEPPLDPRIKAGNDKIGETIKMFGKGAKVPSSIEAKLQNKNCQLSMIRDINRIGLLPRKPEYAKDFTHIMAMLNPPKVVGTGDKGDITIPQLFEEPPEVFENGYYNQKICIALDRIKKSRNPTEGNIGTMAEIKIIPAAMHRADELTAIIKPIRSQIAKYGQVIGAKDAAANAALRERLCDNYEVAKVKFERELAKVRGADKTFKATYEWPKFPGEINKTHKKLGEQLLRVAREINRDAILGENKEWKEAYVTTHEIQDLSMSHQFSRKYNPRDLPRTDRLPNEWIDPIAASIHLDVPSLRRAIVERLRGERWRTQGSENGKH